MSSAPACSWVRRGDRRRRSWHLHHVRRDRRPHHHGHEDAGRDGGREPVNRVVRRLRAQRDGRLGRLLGGLALLVFWVIVVGFEAVAGAKIIQYWVDIPLWSSALALMPLMTGTNLFSVSSFGEFEFWFAGIKVAAIGFFIACGSLFVLGAWPDKGLDFSNLWATAASCPTARPLCPQASSRSSSRWSVRRSRRSRPLSPRTPSAPWPRRQLGHHPHLPVLRRFGVPPLGDPALELTELSGSPFVAAFTEMGIPYADDIMNAVVLTAVRSCLNSGLYTSSGMLFVLAARREAPAQLVKVHGPWCADGGDPRVVGCRIPLRHRRGDRRGRRLPVPAELLGAIILFVYLLISISQIRLRMRSTTRR